VAGRHADADSRLPMIIASYVPVMCSGRMGTRRSGLPVAARTAAAIAGPEEIVGGSPTPRTP
jgi:hypothetical protein